MSCPRDVVAASKDFNRLLETLSASTQGAIDNYLKFQQLAPSSRLCTALLDKEAIQSHFPEAWGAVMLEAYSTVTAE